MAEHFGVLSSRRYMLLWASTWCTLAISLLLLLLLLRLLNERARRLARQNVFMSPCMLHHLHRTQQYRAVTVPCRRGVFFLQQLDSTVRAEPIQAPSIQITDHARRVFLYLFRGARLTLGKQHIGLPLSLRSALFCLVPTPGDAIIGAVFIVLLK